MASLAREEIRESSVKRAQDIHGERLTDNRVIGPRVNGVQQNSKIETLRSGREQMARAMKVPEPGVYHRAQEHRGRSWRGKGAGEHGSEFAADLAGAHAAWRGKTDSSAPTFNVKEGGAFTGRRRARGEESPARTKQDGRNKVTCLAGED